MLETFLLDCMKGCSIVNHVLELRLGSFLAQSQIKDSDRFQ